MAPHFHDPVSTEPTSYNPLSAPETPVTTEHVSPPMPPFDDPEQSSDDADADLFSADDESCWDVFLPDADEIDRLPEPGDFWVDDE